MNGMLDELTKQAMVFIGTVGAVVSGLIGLITRHTGEVEGVNWRKVINELPIAVFSGLVAAGVGGYLHFPAIVTYALATSMAHVGPPTITMIIQMIISSRFGGRK